MFTDYFECINVFNIYYFIETAWYFYNILKQSMHEKGFSQRTYWKSPTSSSYHYPVTSFIHHWLLAKFAAFSVSPLIVSFTDNSSVVFRVVAFHAAAIRVYPWSLKCGKLVKGARITPTVISTRKYCYYRPSGIKSER